MPCEAPVMTATFLSLLMFISFILLVTDIPVPTDRSSFPFECNRRRRCLSVTLRFAGRESRSTAIGPRLVVTGLAGHTRYVPVGVVTPRLRTRATDSTPGPSPSCREDKGARWRHPQATPERISGALGYRTLACRRWSQFPIPRCLRTAWYR